MLQDGWLQPRWRWNYSPLLLGLVPGQGVHRGASAARGTRRSGRGAGRLATAAATGSGVGRATSVNADGKNNTDCKEACMLRRLGVMFLLAGVVSISTAGCLLVPFPVGWGGGHHHRDRGRW